jgi:acetyl-CoA carboxylase beta subunit
MGWFKKMKAPLAPVETKKVQMPEGIWTKCKNCNEIIYTKEIERNLNVCRYREVGQFEIRPGRTLVVLAETARRTTGTFNAAARRATALPCFVQGNRRPDVN